MGKIIPALHWPARLLAADHWPRYSRENSLPKSTFRRSFGRRPDRRRPDLAGDFGDSGRRAGLELGADDLAGAVQGIVDVGEEVLFAKFVDQAIAGHRE